MAKILKGSKSERINAARRIAVQILANRGTEPPALTESNVVATAEVACEAEQLAVEAQGLIFAQAAYNAEIEQLTLFILETELAICQLGM